MADFINTIEILGDDNVVDSIINRTITEFKDNNVKILGNNAFNGCAALEIVDLPEFESNNVQVERIFANCSSLKTVNLPKLKYVYTAAFEGCTSLTSIYLPEADTRYGGGRDDSMSAFSGCKALYKAVLPKVSLISNYFFYGCTSLAIVDLTSCNHIGGYWAWMGVAALKALVLRNTEIVATLSESHTFKDGHIGKGTGYIYVPKALIDAYKVATNWSTYAAQFRALEDYTVDGTITGDLDETKI